VFNRLANAMSSRDQLAKKALLGLTGFALLGLPFLAGRPSEAQVASYNYFPTANTTDAKMLSLGGSAVKTLGGETIDLQLVAPAGSSTFEIGFFDGDTGRDASGAINPPAGHWDFNSTQLIYRLYSNPNSDATPDVLLAEWRGNDPNPLTTSVYTASSATMPDNEWWSAVINNQAQARATDGSFIYLLQVSLADPSAYSVSNFKLRTSVSTRLLPGTFAFEGALRTEVDTATIYPQFTGYPVAPNFFVDAVSSGNTTYNGQWTFFLDVPAGLTELPLWDGDFDYGTGDLISRPAGISLPNTKDTDDPDSPNTVPAFAAGTAAVAEGAQGAGEPEDDNDLDKFRRSPSVTYTLTAPNGTVYTNLNPSGNMEWELFRIAAPAGQTLPAGVWRLDITGLDLSNLNFLRFPVPLIGQTGGGIPGSEVPPTEEPPASECCAKVTGGGWITVATDTKKKASYKGTFGFNAQCMKKGGFHGSLEFQDHFRGLNVHSTSITNVVVEGVKATFTGTVQVNNSGSYAFTVIVEDNGEPGRNDTFRISVPGLGANGYQASGKLAGGNIQIHKCK